MLAQCTFLKPDSRFEGTSRQGKDQGEEDRHGKTMLKGMAAQGTGSLHSIQPSGLQPYDLIGVAFVKSTGDVAS